MISYTDLIPGKEYYIQTYDKLEYFKGMKFHDYQAHICSRPLYDYVNMIFQRTTRFYVFDELDYYYDPEKIRDNAEQAREKMEQRSLDMILKK